MQKIGIITYNAPHLKTEQVLLNLLHLNMCGGGGINFMIYILPFKESKERAVLFSHRPNQTNSIHPKTIAKGYGLPYKECLNDVDIDNGCDLYVITGSRILSSECVKNKKIINAHPGIIPACRGLDSFKWSIYEDKPLGVSLHYIDENVDSGEVISVMQTDVFEGDTIQTLANRHYANEIYMLSNFMYYLKNPINSFKNIAMGESKMRMNLGKEREMMENFCEYVNKYKRVKN